MSGLRALAGQLRDHLRADFDPVAYGFSAALIVALTVLNYGYGAFDGLDRTAREARQLLPFIAFYGLPWAAVVAVLWRRGRLQLDEPGFFRAATVGVLVVAVADWFPFHRDLALAAPRPLLTWVNALAWNLKSTLCWFTPLLVYWLAFDRGRIPACYGLTTRGFDPRPYLLCLAVVAPLVAWASFQPAFLSMYPTYRPGTAEAWLGVSPMWTVLPYELVYGFDFAFVELYFRGFLVIGMARWLGRSAVLPMVVMYAALHFGKPLAETIGSVIGGYILGVFALHSRSIAGGVLLHLGLAWSMEAAAFWQHARGLPLDPVP